MWHGQRKLSHLLWEPKCFSIQIDFSCTFPDYLWLAVAQVQPQLSNWTEDGSHAGLSSQPGTLFPSFHCTDSVLSLTGAFYGRMWGWVWKCQHWVAKIKETFIQLLPLQHFLVLKSVQSGFLKCIYMLQSMTWVSSQCWSHCWVAEGQNSSDNEVWI